MKTVLIDQLFENNSNSYQVIEKAKKFKMAGYKYININKLVDHLSIGVFMHIVVALSVNNYSIDDIKNLMMNSNNWIKDPKHRYYNFKPMRWI